MQIDHSARVLVTGATGFIGQTLLSALSKRDCQIKLLARPGKAARQLALKYTAELFEGELVNESLARKACDNTTHIFHLASSDQYADRESIFQVNVEATKVLAAAAAEQSQPPRFIFISSVAVHGDTAAQRTAPGERMRWNEQSRFHAQTIYEQAKLAAELWLRDVQLQLKLPITILRPCAVVGPGDKRLLKLFRLANRRLIPIVGGGLNHYQIIHVSDLTQLMIAAAENTKAIGQTYICGNAEVLQLRELISLISESSRAHRSKANAHIVTVPLRAAQLGIKFIAGVCKLLGAKPSVTIERLAFFTTSHRFDTTKASRELCQDSGLSFVHSNRTAVADAQRWYKNQHWL